MTKTHTLPKGTRMNLETADAPTKIAVNFLDHMFEAHDTPLGADEKLELTKIVCNALTNQVMWSLISHANQRKRSEERSLDERNEQDENLRGQALSDHLTDASGFHVRTDPLKIAAMCDGMRVHAYDQLHSMFEMAEADEVLYREPAFSNTDPRRSPGSDSRVVARSGRGCRLGAAGSRPQRIVTGHVLQLLRLPARRD